MAEDLHRQVSRMAAGLVLFHDTNTKGSIEMVADRFATEVIDLIRADERERIARAWSWKEWPMLTKHVKKGSVIGAAQAVTDWLRGGAR